MSWTDSPPLNFWQAEPKKADAKKVQILKSSLHSDFM